jgi:hypothetical protein
MVQLFKMLQLRHKLKMPQLKPQFKTHNMVSLEYQRALVSNLDTQV